MKHLLVVFLACTIISQVTGQIRIGIGAEYMTNSIHNRHHCSRGCPDHYIESGHFDRGFIRQNETFTTSPGLIINLPIGKNGWFLSSGVFYVKNKYAFDLRDTMNNGNEEKIVEERLNILLDYIQIPFKIKKEFSLSPTSDLNIAAGFNYRPKIRSRDNWKDIIFVDPDTLFVSTDTKYAYRQFIMAPALDVSYSHDWPHFGQIEVGLSVDITLSGMTYGYPFSWGFYNDLVTARNLRYGLHLRYLLPHSRSD